METIGQKLTELAEKEPTLLLIDGDVILHRVLTTTTKEHHWDNNISTLHVDENEAICKFSNIILDIHVKCGTQHSCILFFSNKYNFRYDLLPEYKQNRKDRRGLLFYQGLKNWAISEYSTVLNDDLEADDLLGIYASLHLKLSSKKAIVASNDKDMLTINCYYFNIVTNEVIIISQDSADRQHKIQTLSGDSADNYKGCRGIGKIIADRALDADNSWSNVKARFKNAQHDDDYTLQQARVAFILDVNHYDFKQNKPILWEYPNNE